MHPAPRQTKHATVIADDCVPWERIAPFSDLLRRRAMLKWKCILTPADNAACQLRNARGKYGEVIMQFLSTVTINLVFPYRDPIYDALHALGPIFKWWSTANAAAKMHLLRGLKLGSQYCCLIRPTWIQQNDEIFPLASRQNLLVTQDRADHV